MLRLAAGDVAALPAAEPARIFTKTQMGSSDAEKSPAATLLSRVSGLLLRSFDGHRHGATGETQQRSACRQPNPSVLAAGRTRLKFIAVEPPVNLDVAHAFHRPAAGLFRQ